MMSLDSVEKAIRESDAVTYYESLLMENAALKTKVERLEKLAGERNQSHAEEIWALKIKISELEGDRIKYKKKSYTPKAFAKLVAEEVERENLERISQGIEERWNKEAPSRTMTALKRELSGGLEKCSTEVRAIIEQHGEKLAQEILKNKANWPEWFTRIYKEEVSQGIQRGLDATFFQQLNERTTKEIEYRVNVSWPRYMAERVTPKFQGTLIDLLKRLEGPIIARCDKCGNEYQLSFTPDNIAALIREPQILIPCLNSACNDFIFRHRYPITLGDVIYYLTHHTT